MYLGHVSKIKLNFLVCMSLCVYLSVCVCVYMSIYMCICVHDV